DQLAEQIAKACSAARVIVTDVGHPFIVKVHQALEKYAAGARRLSYYDNPEAFVPGGYSAVAAEVMQASQAILFANANLSKVPLYKSKEPLQEIDCGQRKRVGIGYYPIEAV